jgi:hypothetical protein
MHCTSVLASFQSFRCSIASSIKRSILRIGSSVAVVD